MIFLLFISGFIKQLLWYPETLFDKQCLVSTRSRDIHILNKQENTREERSAPRVNLTRRDSVAALAVVVVRYSQQYWGILRAAGWLPGRILRSPTCRCRGRAHRGCWLAGSRAWWRGRSGDRTLTARNDCSLLT